MSLRRVPARGTSLKRLTDAPIVAPEDAMTTDALSKLLATRDWLMADGATGTNLFNMGLTAGEPPEFWNVEHPDRIRSLYRSAVEAGSDIFLTNTFGGNASRLKLHNAQGRVRELNRIGASLGREIADAAGRPVVVAGSVGPTGDIFEPMGTLTHAAAVEMFHEQAEGLKEGGADVLWIETISAPEEYKAAAEAAKLAGMPWCGTMSFDTAGRTMMGVTSAAMSEMVEKLPNPPIAFGANCGVGASDLLRSGILLQLGLIQARTKGNFSFHTKGEEIIVTHTDDSGATFTNTIRCLPDNARTMRGLRQCLELSGAQMRVQSGRNPVHFRQHPFGIAAIGLVAQGVPHLVDDREIKQLHTGTSANFATAGANRRSTRT